MTFTQHERLLATLMLQELKANKPNVCLMPGHNGKKIRRTTAHNPDWYSRMCEAEKKRRKGRSGRLMRSRTIIRRVDTLYTLNQIANGESPQGLYATRIKDAIAHFGQQHNFRDAH